MEMWCGLARTALRIRNLHMFKGKQRVAPHSLAALSGCKWFSTGLRHKNPIYIGPNFTHLKFFTNFVLKKYEEFAYKLEMFI